MQITRPATDVVAFTASAEIPGLGYLPVNAYLIQAQQPMLIDTGMRDSSPAFLEALWSVIDPADLRWVYLTHPDRDHTGSLTAVLAAAPHARLVTTFLGMGILGIDFDIPPPRGYLLNPAQTLDLGDRVVEAFRPPVYDSPATTGVFDPKGGACFTSDCFGAPMGSADLVHAEDVAVLAHEDLVAGQRLWTTVDSPWVTSVDRGVFAKSLDHLRRFDARTVLSSHLPPARNMPRLLDTLAGTPDVDPFVGPDQQALEAMLAQFEPAMR